MNVNLAPDHKPEKDESSEQEIVVKANKPLEKLLDWKEIKKFFVDAKAFMTALTTEEAKYQHKIEVELHEQVRPAVIFGAIVLAITIGFFVIWSGIAPLDSAVMAQGSITLSGSRKTVQFLEGGVIEKILVEDGDSVKENQPLIIINSSQARARVDTLRSHLRLVKSIKKRLLAEEYDYDKVDFSDPILDTNDPEVQIFIRNQTSLFDSTKKALKLQNDILNQRLIQKQEDLKVHDAKLKAYVTLLASYKEQLATSQKLFDQGLELKPKLLQIKNAVENTEAEMHATNASIARTKEEIVEAELQKINTENDYRQKLAEKYKENRSAVLQYTNDLSAAEDVLARTTIRSPSAGIVTGLRYHTIGGVISQGAPVMDIIPQDDKLIVEAMVQTQDIESIHVGLEAKIQLNAFKSRLVPRISGEVIYVSADKLTDEKSGMPYYLARIEIKDRALDEVNYDIKLYPGMPVTVFIVKGTRTFLQYLLSPIVDSFHKAFKEA